MIRKILITGATGYIGRRLKERLLADPEARVRLLVRNIRKVRPATRERVEIVEGDTFSRDSLARAVAGVDVAYYLIHSMGAGKKDFEDLDRRSAENFRDACIAAGVEKIVYLGGLGKAATASRHLLSRLETGEILCARSGEIRTVWLRAGVIIGAGSASFEIIRNLVEKLPLMLTPRWVATRTQPIAVGDVLDYLVAAGRLETAGNVVVDIGGSAMSFKQMMLETARVMGLRRLLLPVPVLTPRLSSYWLILFTPVPYGIAAALVEGLKSETLVLNDNARRYFPEIVPMAYSEAVAAAISELVEEQVVSRWCDSSGGAVCDIAGQTDPGDALLRDVREVTTGDLPAACLYASATAVGGEEGWLAFNFLWRLRGLIDKLLGGCGLSRGRRAPRELRVGDALDFWKVIDLKPGKRILLLAQMKLPGKAWLEFDIREGRFVQTAHFLPQGLWGRLYWYAVLPLHHFVFRGLSRKIVARARALCSE